ncbi:MAG: STAS domain-containing protein [Solirubrobacteraceae bacterium]
MRGTDAGTVIAVRGDMDVASIEALDAALEQALAGAPPRVTVDLRGVGFVDSSGLRFLLRANARSRNEGWALEIYRPGETAIKALAVTGVLELLPFVDAGPALVATQPGGEATAAAESERTLRLEIPSTLMAPRTARVALRELLADHPLAAPRLDTLTLLVSEIVTNAVTHAEPEGEGVVEFNVTVTADLTRVRVSDSGSGFEWPAESLPPGRVDGGYGITLLDGQASRWGTRRVPGRFTVWFEVDHVPRAADARSRADAVSS